MNSYPTDEELDRITTWPLGKWLDLAKYVQSLWWMPGWGCVIDLSDMTMELHTGGWSGNESIIQALQEHKVFWAMCWKVHERGGHYYFDSIVNFGHEDSK